jgi:hypothetical protein
VYHIHLKLSNVTWYKNIMKKLSFNKNDGGHANAGRGGGNNIPNTKTCAHTSLMLERCDSVMNLFDPPNDRDYSDYDLIED